MGFFNQVTGTHACIVWYEGIKQFCLLFADRQYFGASLSIGKEGYATICTKLTLDRGDDRAQRPSIEPVSPNKLFWAAQYTSIHRKNSVLWSLRLLRCIVSL